MGFASGALSRWRLGVRVCPCGGRVVSPSEGRRLPLWLGRRACRSTMAARLPSSSPSGAASPSAAWIHGGRGVPLSRLPCAAFGRPVPPGLARAAGRSFLARRSGGAFRSSGLPLPPAAMPSGLASCVALGGVRRVPRALPLPPLLRLPAPSPAVLGLFLAALGAVVLYGCGGGLVGDWLGV